MIDGMIALTVMRLTEALAEELKDQRITPDFAAA